MGRPNNGIEKMKCFGFSNYTFKIILIWNFDIKFFKILIVQSAYHFIYFLPLKQWNIITCKHPFFEKI